MRLVSRYLLRELILPFILSLLIIVFILFINFLLRAIDRFLGKGLDIQIILEYLFLNLAWIIALSVPMAVLIATLMTFGRLSEDNEINAMRASGISFLSIIRAPLIFGLFIASILIYFNNFILPEMNFRARLLSGDIYRKRPDMNIEPGIFIDNLPGYSMIIGEKSNNLMHDVRIFSKGKKESQTSIRANSGNISTLKDAFLLSLFDGEIHELEVGDFTNYRRIAFKKHNIIIPADDLLLNRRDSSNRTDREMNVSMMLKKINDYRHREKVVVNRIKGVFFRTFGDSIEVNNKLIASKIINEKKSSIESDNILTNIEIRKKERQIRNLERQLKNEFNLLKSYQKAETNNVEIHKKFSIHLHVYYLLLGAPLGVMAKEGFAVSTSLSFIFFLVYYILLLGCEKMADRNLLDARTGMWFPNLIMFIISLYLTIYTVREQAPISFFKRQKSK